MSTLDPPLRADAERNRQRILDAAGELFAERGIDVSMEDIARAAGVGVGTLYRRFADREALVDALFHRKIEAVAGLARECAEIEDPWDALRTFIVGAAAMQARDRGLKETLLSSGRGCERVAQGRETIRPIVQGMVERARAAGVLREDFDGFDIPMMQLAIGYAADRMRDVAPEYHERLVTIFLDGIAARRDGATPMPVPPLTPAEFDRRY